MTEVRFSKEFFDEKLKEDCYFIKQSLITMLPLDWIDFCMACHSAMHSDLQAYVVILDDDATAKVMRIIAKEEVDIYILDEDNERLWHIHAIKNKKSEYCFLGGENLRQFCDKENIFYESSIMDDKLISFSNLKWLKKDGEDCRIPLSEEEKQKRISEHKGK